MEVTKAFVCPVIVPVVVVVVSRSWVSACWIASALAWVPVSMRVTASAICLENRESCFFGARTHLPADIVQALANGLGGVLQALGCSVQLSVEGIASFVDVGAHSLGDVVHAFSDGVGCRAQVTRGFGNLVGQTAAAALNVPRCL